MQDWQVSTCWWQARPNKIHHNFKILLAKSYSDIFRLAPSVLYVLRTLHFPSVQLSSVQLLSRVQPFVTPWTAAHQASLSITNSQSLLKLMSIELVAPSNCLILCHPLFLLPSIIPSIRVFSNESVLCIRWPKYWSSASASVLPMNIQGCFPFKGSS